jgi:hypothetical protein
MWSRAEKGRPGVFEGIAESHVLRSILIVDLDSGRSSGFQSALSTIPERTLLLSVPGKTSSLKTALATSKV